MYRILVAVDGSEDANRAAKFAVDLARRLGDAELLLLNVQDPVEESQTHGLARDAINKHREEVARDAAAKARAIAESAGIKCTFEWLFGNAAHTIADRARSAACDLIVMGKLGHTRIENALLGSVVQPVLRLATVPITLVP
jgi:nucleotide-binding universal stress UspA family protein